MLTKCANTTCPTPLRYLRHGKIFRLGSDCAADLRVEKSSAGPAPVEHFWLCGNCCQTFTLIRDRFLGVLVVPKEMALPGKTEHSVDLRNVDLRTERAA
jgi:hypothetical protein